MLIPSIDLKGGRVVQLQQGERLAWASDDLDGWVERFARFQLVQVIDLDAAAGTGSNRDAIARLCRRLPCQVGGGIRSAVAAQSWLDEGAARVIIGSMLFMHNAVNVDAAAELASAIGRDKLVAAVDCRANRVTVAGWTRTLAVAPIEAMSPLEPFAGAFLATFVDDEGMLGGLDFDRAMLLRRATMRPLIVAGGIRDQQEIDRLHAAGIDAVVGMAIYTGRIPLEAMST
jgi:phosphoribosylformimino-5-aminoimidazole carboxamide ribotide isomerase